jgi:hypothetical protein
MTARITAYALALFAMLAFAAAPALGAATPWDQAKVTALAQDLAKSVNGINDALAKLSPPTVPGTGRRAFFELRDNARRIESETRRLADELAKGKGLDETAGAYKHISMQRRDAAENIRNAGMIPQDVTAKIEGARDLLNELDKYYAE